jgi:hypothetical protein
MPRNSLTMAVIKEEVATALGGSRVEIELLDDDYQKCMRDMIRVLNRNRPGRGRAAIHVTPSQKKYGPLDPKSTPAFPATIQGIVKCAFVTNQAPITDPFDTINNGIGRVLSGQGTPFGEIDQQLQYIKLARVVASSDPEWQQAWEGPSLFVYVDIARTPVLCSIEYTFHFTPDDDPINGVSMIPDGDTDMVVGFVAARAKQILGRQRMKHGGIVNPDGATDTVDGDALLSEGKDEEDKWTEEIRSRRRPLLPVIG